jgi:hypothetical protein
MGGVSTFSWPSFLGLLHNSQRDPGGSLLVLNVHFSIN